jgi:PncC family amidohydrolase
MAAPDDMVDLSAALGHRLRAQGWSVSSAESCTGGGIALAITSIAGSSDYFDGAIVAYSNEIKQRLLNVSPETLETVGAVSPECAREMAHGIRAALDTDVGISSTGIAGPGGATARKPLASCTLRSRPIPSPRFVS